MTDDTKTPDLSQRIAEAMARTSEPLASGDGEVQDNSEIIGSVPMHLRHLHNLLVELSEEAKEIALVLAAKSKQAADVHTIFFTSLKEQVPVPENATALVILENWDVAAVLPSADGEDGMEGLSAAALMEAMMGRFR